MFVLKLT